MEHLIQQIHYLGPGINYDGQMFERKNSKIRTKIQSIFGGGSISEQIVASETTDENLKMSMKPLLLSENDFDADSWIKLVTEW